MRFETLFGEAVPAVAVQGEVVDNTTKTSHSTNFLTTSLSRADPPSRGGTTYLPESLSSLSSSSSRGRTRSRSIEPASQRGRTRSCSVGPPSVARSSKQQVQPEVNNTKSHLVMTSRVDSICNQIYNYLDELDAKISHVRQSRSLVKSSSGNDSRGNGGSADHTSRVCHSESDRLSSVDILKNGLGIYPPYPRLDEDTTRGRRSPSTVVATNRYSPKSSLKRLDSCSSYSLARKSSSNSSTQTHLSRKSDCDAATAKNKYSSENKEVESGKLSSPKQVHPRAANTATAARRSRSFSRSRSITRRYINSELNPSLTKIFKRLPSKEVVTLATTSENTKSSTASVSTRESSEDNCDRSPIVSVMRSFQDSSSPGTNNNKAEGRKGRCRRRASSLSRQAVQALTTLDATTSSFDYSIHSVLSNDNLIIDANNKPSKKRNHQQQLSMLEMEHSKASMVYDVPFDPITGQCHYHPSVCMAVKMTEEEEEDESTSDNNGVVVGHRGRVQQQSKSTTAATVVVAGWKIVRTTCPKCMYNY